MMIQLTDRSGRLFYVEHSKIVYVCDADNQVYKDGNGQAMRDKCCLSVISLAPAGYIVVNGKPEDIVKRIRHITNHETN